MSKEEIQTQEDYELEEQSKLIKVDNFGANELMVYQNEFNTAKMKGMTLTESNLMHAILSKLRNRGQDLIVLDAIELRDISGYNDDINNTVKFGRHLMYLFDQSSGMGVRKYNKADGDFVVIPFFSIIRYIAKENKVVMKVNPSLEYLFNGLTGNFTTFELYEFIGLKTKHSQPIYRLLKQYKFLGRLKLSMKDIHDYMDIPKSYDTKAITQKVINPAVRELKGVFKELEVTPYKRGRVIEGYEFTFKPETKAKVVAQSDKRLIDDTQHNYDDDQELMAYLDEALGFNK